MDATLKRRIPPYTLEVQRQIISRNKHRSRKQKNSAATSPNNLHTEHRERNHGRIALMPVPRAENRKHRNCTAKQPNNFRTLPRESIAGEVESKEELDGGRGEEHEAYQVKFREWASENGLPVRLGDMVGYCDPKKEGEEETTCGEVDIET